MKAPKPFTATCVIESLHGVVHVYRGVICYVPEADFYVGQKVRVTVEPLDPGQIRKRSKRK